MRIQDTDRILKDSRDARHSTRIHEKPGLFTRLWHMVTGLFK